MKTKVKQHPNVVKIANLVKKAAGVAGIDVTIDTKRSPRYTLLRAADSLAIAEVRRYYKQPYIGLKEPNGTQVTVYGVPRSGVHSRTYKDDNKAGQVSMTQVVNQLLRAHAERERRDAASAERLKRETEYNKRRGRVLSKVPSELRKISSPGSIDVSRSGLGGYLHVTFRFLARQEEDAKQIAESLVPIARLANGLDAKAKEEEEKKP